MSPTFFFLFLSIYPNEICGRAGPFFKTLRKINENSEWPTEHFERMRRIWGNALYKKWNYEPRLFIDPQPEKSENGTDVTVNSRMRVTRNIFLEGTLPKFNLPVPRKVDSHSPAPLKLFKMNHIALK
jgi:hypothetical protein